MDIQEALTGLNLSPREAQIYTALLELGQATPLQIAKKTGLKRPTVYLDVESLRRKKLAGLAPKGKKTVYIAESPNKLSSLVEEQHRTLKEVLPLLKALETRSENRPAIRFYDRKEEIAAVWAAETREAENNCYISNISIFLKQFPGVQERINEQVAKGIMKNTRIIVTAHDVDLAYAKQYDKKDFRVRVSPEAKEFNIDISIWQDNVGLYSMEKEYLVLITDPAIAQAFRILFDITWAASQDPKTLAKKPSI